LLFLLCIVASTDVRRTTVLRTVQEPEDLFEVISQCLLSAVDRDALSGWGAVITIMYVVPG
jgi:20S proteasome alpha/beta subunit